MDKTIRIVVIADTHLEHWTVKPPPGDVLIHAGDAVLDGTDGEWRDFNTWYEGQPHAHKVFIPGNHDRLFDEDPEKGRHLLPAATVLINEETGISGLRIYGTPWTPAFNNWAFNTERGGELAKKYSGITSGLDILVSHGPPEGILDMPDPRTNPFHLGSAELKSVILKTRPRLVVFGHIHGGYGSAHLEGIPCINASICTETYYPANKPVVVDLKPDGTVRILPPA